jgi:hypothetical protein
MSNRLRAIWLAAAVAGASALTGTPASTEQSAPPVATPPASPAAETVLYQEDASGGFDEWDLDRSWQIVGGMLVNDGTGRRGQFAYPPDVDEDIADYAVEAEIQVVGLGGEPGDCANDEKLFAIDVRESDAGLYSFEVQYHGNCRQSEAYLTAHEITDDRGEERFDVLANRSFVPGPGWRTYRVEALGPTLRVSVDGVLVLEAEDDRFLTGELLTLYSDEVRLNVRSFRVVAL